MSTFKYTACKHIQRKEPDFEVNQDVADFISKNYRTMPLFEKSLFVSAYTKLYSLDTNDLLRCRWKEYKKVEGRTYTPFQFLDTRDFHFYLYNCRFAPLETIHKRSNHRNKMRPGPGVDLRGQLPIPNELQMKRQGADSGNRKFPKKYPKELKDANEEDKK